MNEMEGKAVEEVSPSDRPNGGGEGLTTTIKKSTGNISIPEAIELEEGKGLASEIKKEDVPLENSTQLSTSRWTNMTRVFKHGLSLDSAVPHNITNTDPVSVALHDKPVLPSDKRKSLGKLFRQGLKLNAKSSYTSSESVEHPEAELNKQGTFQRLFRYGKSSHSLKESSSTGTRMEDSLNANEFRLPAPPRKGLFAMKPRHKTESKDENEQEHEDLMPSTQLRRGSLGKLFRQSKDFHVSNLLTAHSKSSKKSNDTPGQTSLKPPRIETRKKHASAKQSQEMKKNDVEEAIDTEECNPNDTRE